MFLRPPLRVTERKRRKDLYTYLSTKFSTSCFKAYCSVCNRKNQHLQQSLHAFNICNMQTKQTFLSCLNKDRNLI